MEPSTFLVFKPTTHRMALPDCIGPKKGPFHPSETAVRDKEAKFIVTNPIERALCKSATVKQSGTPIVQQAFK